MEDVVTRARKLAYKIGIRDAGEIEITAEYYRAAAADSTDDQVEVCGLDMHESSRNDVESDLGVTLTGINLELANQAYMDGWRFERCRIGISIPLVVFLPTPALPFRWIEGRAHLRGTTASMEIAVRLIRVAMNAAIAAPKTGIDILDCSASTILGILRPTLSDGSVQVIDRNGRAHPV